MNSSAWASTWVSPRSVLISTGKNTITATMLILASGLVMPNQLFMIGASAIIGVELIATANGIIPSLMAVQRAVASAIDTPLPVPPENVHCLVASKAPWVEITDGLPQFAETAPKPG